MALIGNRSVLLKSPGRFLSGTVASIERNNFSTAGQGASRFQAMSPIFGGIPSGHLAPSSWSLPRTPGAMSSVNSAVLSMSTAGLAVGGITAVAATSFAISVPDATGALIASGSGSASMAFAGAGTMTGNISGTGSASFSLSTNNPLLGALADGTGAASFTFAVNGALLPTDDTPPARTASAGFTFTAAAVPSAIGHMVGSTIDAGAELTTGAIADATVAALQATVIPVDVKRMNSADVVGDGTAGNKWRGA